MLPFHFKKVTTKGDLKEVFRLRYKVYCEEWGFERIEDHPGGIEFDKFDDHSLHFISLNNKTVVGTIRIILNSEKGFPIEKNCKIDMNISNLNKDKVGEISRLAVSKELRKRIEDRFIYDGIPEYHSAYLIPDERRKRHEIVIGLYKCIYVESKKLGITHWYAVMAKGLYLLLKRLGIVFSPIGPETDYHGIRTPYIGSIENIEADVSRLNPELLREFNEALK